MVNVSGLSSLSEATSNVLQTLAAESALRLPPYQIDDRVGYGWVSPGRSRWSRSSSCATSRSQRSTCRSRRRCSNLLSDLCDEFGLTYLLIAHGLNVVKHISDRVGVMYLGRLVEVAQKRELYSNPLHPYTKALLSAIPVTNPAQRKERILLEGDVSSPIDPPQACRLSSRCYAKAGCVSCACDTKMPELVEVSPGHFVSCYLFAGDGDARRGTG